MGRRRKKRARRVVVVKRKLPTVFQCPRCGASAVGVSVKKGGREKYVVVSCSNCGLKARYDYVEYLEPVDYFSRFLDDYEAGKIPLEGSVSGGSDEGASEELHTGED